MFNEKPGVKKSRKTVPLKSAAKQPLVIFLRWLYIPRLLLATIHPYIFFLLKLPFTKKPFFLVDSLFNHRSSLNPTRHLLCYQLLRAGDAMTFPTKYLICSCYTRRYLYYYHFFSIYVCFLGRGVRGLHDRAMLTNEKAD
jgi:hypothetical protein